MRIANRLLVIGIAVICVVIYLYTAAPFMLWEDASRFVAAIVTLGIAYPSEPVYVFLAHVFTYLPFGSVIFRIQMFSALLAGGSLLLLYRLVIRILEKPILLRKKNKVSLKQPPLLLAGIFSMLVLAFSYQFWSQAQNVETFILDCFIELIVLNLLLSEITYKTVFAITAVVVFICGVATGTDPPVIASIFPSVFLVVWYWKAGLGKKRLFVLFLLGFVGFVLAWSYLPFAEIRKPQINYENGLTFQGLLHELIGNQWSNVYEPSIGLKNGITWSPTVMLTSAWHYFVMAWMDFTPILLTLIVLGAIYLWRYQRRIFIVLFLVVVTNFIFSSLYLSGNQESWYLQSDVIFAVIASAGYAWVIAIVSIRAPKLDLRFAQAGLLAIAFLPLIYWWSTLDRHSWHFTQDYINNLYSPIQEPAILVGSADLWEATSAYVYNASNYKHNIIPVWDEGFYRSALLRTNLASTSHIKIPDASHLNFSSPTEFSKFMNNFFAENIGKYHIYLTIPAFEGKAGERTLLNLQIDSNRFSLIPVGMLQEVILKNEKPDFNLNNFTYHFDNGFPKNQPHFLEESYTGELQDVISEIALSYENAANFLEFQGHFDEANSFYHKAYALAPKTAQILGGLGLFYGRQKQPAKALDYFMKAHEVQPDNLTWLYDIAISKGQLGKIDEEKKDLKSIIDNPQSDPAHRQSLTEQLNSLNQQAGSPEPNIQPKTLQVPEGWKPYEDTAMNLHFAYPPTLQVTQISPQLVSLSDPSHPDMKDGLLIYSTVMSSGNLSNVPVPFSVPGQLLSSNPVQFTGFQAVMDVYSDTTGQTLLLLLQRGQQVFAIRFPEPTAFAPDVLDQIVQSITTLH